MIIRYAIFEGQLQQGQSEAFRDAVRDHLLPKWKSFPGATAVRVAFAESRDDGAPEYPMILSTTYPDMPTLEAALESSIRAESRAATEVVLSRFFVGRIHHHVTVAQEADL